MNPLPALPPPMNSPAAASQRTSALHPPVMLDDKLLEFVPGAVYVCDLEGVVVRYNRRAGELWGRYPVPGDPKELYCGSHKLYRANGELMPHDETPMVESLRDGSSFRNVEVQVEQPSGKKIWILVNIDPLRNEDGSIVGVINCFQDITDRKLANERQKMLVNELNHRVKNTLSTVQAIASYTFRAGVGNDAPKWFEARLQALSHAHELLARETWDGANLGELVELIGAPWSGEGSDRSALKGPDVHLEPRLALSLAIALHELFTNAAKFGALSNDTGCVDIAWTLKEADGVRMVEIRWQESLGPTVQLPQHRGFGSRIIERTLVREHDAIVALEFLPAGVRCTMAIPLQ